MSLEELLERQWSQGTAFVMNQAQHFDIATLLSSLSTLKAENDRLEERCRMLASRREHLVAVHARLALPLNGQFAAALQALPPSGFMAPNGMPHGIGNAGGHMMLPVSVASSGSLSSSVPPLINNHIPPINNSAINLGLVENGVKLPPGLAATAAMTNGRGHSGPPTPFGDGTHFASPFGSHVFGSLPALFGLAAGAGGPQQPPLPSPGSRSSSSPFASSYMIPPSGDRAHSTGSGSSRSTTPASGHLPPTSSGGGGHGRGDTKR